MRITWDAKARAIYIYLGDISGQGVKRVKGIQVEGTDIIIDYEAGKVFGIEILNVDTKPVVEDITSNA